MTPHSSRNKILAGVVAGCAVVGVAATAGTATAAKSTPNQATTTTTTTTTLYACQNKKSGAIRMVKTAKTKCKKGEKKVSWNSVGSFPPNVALLTEGASATIQPGGGWFTLQTSTFTAQANMKYQIGFNYALGGGQCADQLGYVNLDSRIVVNGVPIPDGRDAAGDFQSGLPNFGTNWLNTVPAGPASIAVVVRAKYDPMSTNNPGTPCAAETGAWQLYALGYSTGS